MKRAPALIAYLRDTARQYPSLGMLNMIGEAEKLGPKDKFGTFNLPRDRTCCMRRPDGIMIATWVCRGGCYAIQTSSGRPEVLLRALKNWYAAQRPDFAYLMAGAIHRSGVPNFRLHDFGDFFSKAYILAWCQVVRMCPSVQFLIITQAWRVPEFVGPLTKLAAEPNVSLLTSHDREAPELSGIPGTKEAWLMDSDATFPPRDVWVVFRASREKKKVSLKTANGSLVCPAENGTGTEARCHKCRHCFFKECSVGEMEAAEPGTATAVV